MDRHLWLPYAQMKTAPASLSVAKTAGVNIYLEDGRTLIDGIASWWTACHGYNHPRIAAAVAEQLQTVPHIMLGGLSHVPVECLSNRLAEKLPGDLDHCFFSESGSVAVEVAMKMAIQYWTNQGVHGRSQFLSFTDAYHGDTFAAMSVCDPNDGMHQLFKGALAEQHIVALPRDDDDFEKFDQYLARHKTSIAAMLIEPLVQAAGGFKFHDANVLQRICEMVRRHEILVIFDEIATGFGRTGSLFACDQISLVPDIVTLSKALTGGTLPLAVTVARKHIYQAFYSESPNDALMHGPTYCGHALGCAAANASLDLFELEPRLDEVRNIEKQLRAELEVCRGLNGVADVRVRGAIGVVELDSSLNPTQLRQDFVDKGVWIRPFGNVVYLAPALNIDTASLRTLTQSIYVVLDRALAR